MRYSTDTVELIKGPCYSGGRVKVLVERKGYIVFCSNWVSQVIELIWPWRFGVAASYILMEVYI